MVYHALFWQKTYIRWNQIEYKHFYGLVRGVWLRMVITNKEYEFAFNNCPDAILLTLSDGTVLSANPSACELFGYTEDEWCDLKRSDLVDATDSRTSVYLEARKKEGNVEGELIFIKKNGEKFTGHIKSALKQPEKSLGKACVIIKDITELKRAEESLKKNKEKYYDLFYNARVGIFRCRINKMELLDVNKKITELSGYTKEELLNDVSIVKFPYPDEIDNIMGKLEEEGFIENHEVHILDKMGDIRTALVSFKLYPEEDFFEGTVVDITKRKELELKLQKSLEEKEILLKETHHRVKNNLAIISSIINLQSSYFDDPEALNAFKNIQDRANSMSMIHERLYKSKDLKNINFGEYLTRLCNNLYKTYTHSTNISLKLNIENLSVKNDVAVPLGLIVNELFTNSLKYAFPDENGNLQVDFRGNNEMYMLSIKDDGIGLPKDFGIEKTNSLGLTLVKILTEQINGTLELESENGTKWLIKIPIS